MVTIVPIVIGAFVTVTKIIKGTGGLGGWRPSEDQPNYATVDNGENTEKSPGDLRRLSSERPSAKTGVKNSQWVKNYSNYNYNDSENQRKRKETVILGPCPRNKKLWNKRVKLIWILICAIITFPRGLGKELEEWEIGEWIMTIQSIAMLRFARILSKVLETWADLLSLRLHWKTIS